MHVPLVGQSGVLVLETCILEIRNGHIVSKSAFAKDSDPLRHEDVVRSLERFPNIQGLP